MNKYLALQKDVFDINKVTVVGNPTITSDGVASGFSGSDYIRTVNITELLYTANTWIIDTKIITGSVDSTQTIVGDATEGGVWKPQIRIHNKIIQARLGTTSSATSWQIGLNGKTNLKPNTLYYIKLNYTGLKYQLWLSLDGINYILEDEIANDYKVRNSNYKSNIGADTYLNGGVAFPFSGSIDLTQFKIYVDGQLVFQPVKPTYLLERRKEGYDPSKFTVVGTPTITDDGVASGFSGNNYIKTPVINQGNNLDVFVRFNADSFSSMPQIMASKDIQGIALTFTTNNKIGMSLGNGSAWVTQVIGTTTLSIDNDYYAHFLYKDGYYRLFLSEDKINWSKECEYASAINFLPSTAFIIGAGRLPNNSNSFTGSIELPSVSITVDGKEVFTGAKENFYMLRR